jgi:S-adenosylmethionine hydrolase
MIFLFDDFGAADIYAGQVKAVLQQHAPKEAVIDLLHDAPRSTSRPVPPTLASR